MYQALYRKWRPKSFDDVVGQAHISETLKRQIMSGRLSHAYLFVGTRGTGKTTCAKILSRALNCEHPENGNPCNKCPSCLGIENGSILDVLELDAASNNGVDNVRALREEAVFTPVQVKKRVYIIDEVHMLSTPAFNALLKILEEPPEHLIFILATTEIHKVPATILSRCQRFTFKRILPPLIAERMQHIAAQEGITLTDDAAALLARLSDGSLRDALSLLDQCASEDNVDYGRVLSAIGLAGVSEITELLNFVADSDIAAALGLLDQLYSSGKVMASVLEELTQLARDVLIIALMPKGGAGLLSGGYDQTVLQGFVSRFSTGQLLGIMDILRGSAQDLSKSSGGRLAVELCLMRLCSLDTDCTPSAGVSRPVRPEVSVIDAGKAKPVLERQAESKPATIPPVHQPEAGKQKDSQSVAADVVEPAAADFAGATAAKAASAATETNGDFWKAILNDIKPKIDIAPFTFLCEQAQTEALLDNGTLTIRAKNPFAAKMIDVPAVTAALKESALAVLKKPVVVRVTQEGDSGGGSNSKLDAWTDRFSGVVKVEE